MPGVDQLLSDWLDGQMIVWVGGIMDEWMVGSKADWILLLGGIAQGVPSTATFSELLCVPIWALIIYDLSTRSP
jgi:hypothetical protein